jgi:hypothetical protein
MNPLVAVVEIVLPLPQVEAATSMDDVAWAVSDAIMEVCEALPERLSERVVSGYCREVQTDDNLAYVPVDLA